MNKAAFVTLLILATLPGACTWVKPTGGGDRVRVAYDGNVSGCRDAGSISVSVADHVGPYDRPALKVRDELETLARNQAAEIPADTIKASSEPHDGEQKFEAYVCGNARIRHEARRAGEAQTYPIKDH
jgi:allophanate hydrolase subunit 2